MSINVNLSFFNPTWLNWEDLQGTLGQHWSMNWFSRSHKSEKSFQQEGNNICVKFCTVLHVLSALVTFIIIRVDLRVNRDKTVWLTDWWLIFFLSYNGIWRRCGSGTTGAGTNPVQASRRGRKQHWGEWAGQSFPSPATRHSLSEFSH